MDWIHRMNSVLDYIEENICEEIDTKKIAFLSACPEGVFQRIFSNVTNMTLSEYIRNRRMDKAAFEVQNTDKKIIDIAVKYGYQSSDAFTFAFKRIYNVTPTEARRSDVVLQPFIPLTFALTLTVKGVVNMNYRIVEKEAFQIAGKMNRDYFENTEFWGKCLEDGTTEKLYRLSDVNKLSNILNDISEEKEKKLSEYIFSDTDNSGPIICALYDYDKDNKVNCIIGVETEKSHSYGFDVFDIPKATYAVFDCIGAMPDAIVKVWNRIYREFFPQCEYRHAGTTEFELHFNRDEDSPDTRCEVWIPVIKRE